MARLWMSGFEGNDKTLETLQFLTWNALVGSFSSANPRTGSFALRNTTATQNSATFSGGALNRKYFLRAYVSVSALPAAKTAFLGMGNSAPSRLLELALNPDGTVVLQTQGGGTVIAASTATVSPNSYFLAEIGMLVNTTTTGYAEGRLNGVSFGSSSSLNLNTIVPGQIYFSGFDGTNTLDMDDMALNDDTGTSQTSWPGSGNVVLLVPASDNAKGTGWTNDAATTTNLFDAVNNEPPVGIADTTAGSGLHQIRNATSNANVNYDANLTTYAAAGIGATDTVNVLVPMVATGAPVTTSAKAGTYGIASNPAIANVSLGAGGTAGAFWSGVAAGTYPTGWKWSFGTTTYAPSVTVGTAPVARITQVTSSTRIAMVCAIGMYVDYTPAIPAAQSLIYADRRLRQNSLLRR